MDGEKSNNSSDVKDNGPAMQTPPPKVTPVFSDGPLGLGDILEDAIGSRPEASARADKIITEAAANDTEFIASNVDRSGIVFDAVVHEADSAGNPRKSADGLFRRKRGRKSGVTYAGNGGGGFSGDTSGSMDGGGDSVCLSRTEALKAGRSSAHILFTAGQAIFGAEWQPLTKVQTGGVDEKENLASNLADYYEIRGTVKLPPELGLAIALASVIGPRLALPETKAKVTTFGSRFKAMFGRKKKSKIPDATDTPSLEPVKIAADTAHESYSNRNAPSVDFGSNGNGKVHVRNDYTGTRI